MADRKRKVDLSGLGSTPAEDAAKKRNMGINPFTGSPYSRKYYDILEKRNQLPVHQFLDDLMEKV
ncbi:unnamed protein product, partial [Sphacelaria rigidula]